MIDSQGRTIQIGKTIGKGGEGTVHEIEGDTSLVAKLYHQTPLPTEQIAKLEAMVECWSDKLGALSAWPHSLLYDQGNASKRALRGILIPKISGARHLHELYGTTNRRHHFPEAQWHHLILAARNTAAAFDTIHQANIVIGDVNQGNLLVDHRMVVRLIDCDSFQITHQDQTFFCPVGTPHFTPPELQSKKLREVPRTIDHDHFGLAILIFHLLFVGRHPFVGRYRGSGDLPIEKAIAEQRFAFSKDISTTRLDPPPASLRLEDLPHSFDNLFDRAFRHDPSDGNRRPTAQQWIEQLELLMKARKHCRFDPAHVYFRQLSNCPWCRVEDEGGPSFFVQAGGTSNISQERLESLESRIAQLDPVAFPDLPPQRLTLPGMPLRKKLRNPPNLRIVDLAAALLVVGNGLCLLGIFSGGAWLAGALLTLVSGITLRWGPQGRADRKRVLDDQTRLEQMGRNLKILARKVAANHQQHQRDFNQVAAELNTQLKYFHAEGEQLKKILRQHSTAMKDEFLRKHLIRYEVKKIAGLTNSLVPMLESYGIESALDVDRLCLAGVPCIHNNFALELLQWRTKVEQQFSFKPEHGVTLQDMQQSQALATWRFKVTQSRKVLMASTRLQTIADAAQDECNHGRARFDKQSIQWLEIAKQFRDFQSERRELEYRINRSPLTMLILVAGVPIVSGLFTWFLYAIG
jgi:DNA-binding helix-hairpin-helix protein with protein kinase domain